MVNVASYLHRLEQISCELRDCAKELQACRGRIDAAAEANASKEECWAIYQEYLSHTHTREVVERLQTLVKQLKAEDELASLQSLAPDIIAANSRGLELCDAMMEIAKRIGR